MLSSGEMHQPLLSGKGCSRNMVYAIPSSGTSHTGTPPSSLSLILCTASLRVWYSTIYTMYWVSPLKTHLSCQLRSRHSTTPSHTLIQALPPCYPCQRRKSHKYLQSTNSLSLKFLSPTTTSLKCRWKNFATRCCTRMSAHSNLFVSHSAVFLQKAQGYISLIMPKPWFNG